MDDDRELEETLDGLPGPVDRRGVRAAIEARAGGEHVVDRRRAGQG